MKNTMILISLILSGALNVFSTNILVTSNGDSGLGTLREAVSLAQSYDTISFALNYPDTIRLQSKIQPTTSITIIGPGTNSLVIGNENPGDYIFYCIGSGTIRFYNIFFLNLIYPQLQHAIRSNYDSLIIDNCIFEKTAGNSSTGYGTAINCGASYKKTYSEVTNCSFISNNPENSVVKFSGTDGFISNCTFEKNNAVEGCAGIEVFSATFAASASMKIENCTFGNNEHYSICAGSFGYGTTIDVINCTFYNNLIAPYSGEISHGGYSNSDTVKIYLANNIFNSGFTGFQYVYYNTGNKFFTYSYGGNIADNTSNGIFNQSTDYNNTNALLMPLDDNGGLTKTCALQSGSPAIDNAIQYYAPLFDQRGFPRENNSDIGAFEYHSPNTTHYLKNSFNEYKLYPNPTNDFINIDLLERSTVQVSIYNYNGKKLDIFKYQDIKSLKVDLSKYPVGSYIINIVSKNKEVNYKVLKQ